MGKCMSTSSVLVVDIARSVSERAEGLRAKAESWHARRYTRVNQQEDQQVNITFSDDEHDVVPQMATDEEEINKIFEDNGIDDNI